MIYPPIIAHAIPEQTEEKPPRLDQVHLDDIRPVFSKTADAKPMIDPKKRAAHALLRSYEEASH